MLQSLLLLLDLQCLYKTPKILDHLRKNREKKETEFINLPNEVLHSIGHMTTSFLCVCSVGTLSVDGERRGVGWGQHYIPEYMTRCSRSDRSQPWLMKPKHFHRCFYTLGSTSPPPHSEELSPALTGTVQLTF